MNNDTLERLKVIQSEWANVMTRPCRAAKWLKRTQLGVIAVDARKVAAYQNARVGAAVEGRPIVIEE